VKRLTVLVLVAAAALTGPAVPASAAPGCQLPATRTITDRPWASTRLAFDRVWPLTQGAGQIVGVVDTGVDAGHPMLTRRVLPGVDEVHPGAPGTGDCNGHGTFVAGIVAAGRLPGIGFAGVAPEATILPVRQTSNGQDGTVDTLAAGIRDAVDGHARVVNVSVTFDQPSARLAEAVRYAQEHDVLIVAAVGNQATNGNPQLYPASYPGVLAVGAVGPDGRRTDFSETGTGIAVVAPGKDLLGPGAGGQGLIAGGSGTSFATPFVTGVAALVRAYRPDLTAAQVLHRIEVTADHPAGPLPDPQYGWGVVNPYQAVTAVLPEEYASAPPAPAAAPIRLTLAPARGGGLPVPLLVVLACLAVAALTAFAAATRGRVR
jgi:type VII secretion-associated serine protease mycosin